MTPKSKDEAVKQAYDKGHNYELKYHGCSQCVTLALQEVFDMRNDDIFKAASGFGGGIGGMADTCGALIGAGLMLSLKYGRGREEIKNKQKGKTSGIPVGKLYKWFEKEFGSTKCREIRAKFFGIHYDINVPWQAKLAEKAGLYDKCSDVVGKTAAMTAEMLWDTIKAEKKK